VLASRWCNGRDVDPGVEVRKKSGCGFVAGIRQVGGQGDETAMMFPRGGRVLLAVEAFAAGYFVYITARAGASAVACTGIRYKKKVIKGPAIRRRL
jgi:hypothetical protein